MVNVDNLATLNFPIYYRQCKQIVFTNCRDKLQCFRFLFYTRYDNTLPPVDVIVAVVEDLITRKLIDSHTCDVLCNLAKITYR